MRLARGFPFANPPIAAYSTSGKHQRDQAPDRSLVSLEEQSLYVSNSSDNSTHLGLRADWIFCGPAVEDTGAFRGQFVASLGP